MPTPERNTVMTSPDILKPLTAEAIDDDPEDARPTKAVAWRVNRNTMSLLSVALLGSGVLAFMHFKPGPAAAVAGEADANDAKTAVRTFMAGGAGDLKLMETMLRDTQKVVAQFQQFPAVNQVPLARLKSNPFQTPTVEEAAASPAGDVEKQRRDADRADALRVAQKLTLQSIVVSEKRRTCMINNVMCLQGQQLDGFLIEKVTPVSVIVKRGEYRFELRLQQ